MKIIASHNGLAAAEQAWKLLRDGADALDVCVAAATLVEDDPAETSVGYGGLPNAEGVVELDAAVMHGPTHRAGGVAALLNVRHATQVARLIMQQTNRVLLVGEGALAFARAHGFREENLLTDDARRQWLAWKRTHAGESGWLSPEPETITGQHDSEDHTGTVHFAALDARGDLSCATSTSGHRFKMPGRVGDSPIVGAGLYVDNQIGTCGSTGWGEANQENLSSFAVVERMRSGADPLDAGMEALRRIVEHAQPSDCDAQGRPTFNVRLYAMARDGRHAGVCLWGPQDIAVVDENGARLEPCVPLLERHSTQ
ncbi:MAG: N(4)-(beta-N-acetylglucosaminyl)-L-asparaginase [Pirellulales bacterium]